jgi:arabinose-5-phosphate isomerase
MLIIKQAVEVLKIEAEGILKLAERTDGDLRRLIAKNKSIIDLTVEDVMTKGPRTVDLDSPAYDALNMMEQFQITVLPITDANRKVRGILHLHDILGKGEFKFNGT